MGRILRAEEELSAALTACDPVNAERLFIAIGSYVDARLDELRDEIHERGIYSPDF